MRERGGGWGVQRKEVGIWVWKELLRNYRATFSTKRVTIFKMSFEQLQATYCKLTCAHPPIHPPTRTHTHTHKHAHARERPEPLRQSQPLLNKQTPGKNAKDDRKIKNS